MDAILALLQQAGAHRYGQERVSQRDHALQCAYLAEQEGASAALIVACLLHDIGHLVDGGDDGDALRGIDARHEERGARLLCGWFGEAVSEPVRLHVAAKRYLCATEMGYLATLSPASVRSLNVQGGPFSATQAEAFIQQPYALEAVALRRWDERAKDAAVRPPDLHHFASYIREQLAMPKP
jgi:phosphonate degradation associated HDIG domain protein